MPGNGWARLRNVFTDYSGTCAVVPRPWASPASTTPGMHCGFAGWDGMSCEH